MQNLDIQGTVLSVASGDAFSAALKRNSPLAELPARYVVQPTAYTDIPPVLAYAASQTPPIQLAVKGGGAHTATWSSSDGGIVIDLSKLNKVSLSDDKQTISVQGGAIWGDVYAVTSQAGVDVVGSPFWFIGVGGFTVGGGYGPLSGERGLAVDNLLSATVVLADGRIVKASAREEADLFWAIRGGGGQFGVVVEFLFKTYPAAGPISSGILAYPGAELGKVISIINEWKAAREPSERLTLNFSRPAPHFKPSVLIMPCILRDEHGSLARASLEPFRSVVKPVVDKLSTASDMLALSHSADAALAQAPRRLVIRGACFSDFYPELVLAVWDAWVAFTERSEEVRQSTVIWNVTSPTAIAQVPFADTAFKLRVPHYWVAVQGRSTTDDSVGACREFVASIVSLVREKNTELSGRDLGWAVNLCQGDEKTEDIFGEHLPRLRAVKAKYDPHMIWNKGAVLEPADGHMGV
ncbi:FAD-binding domain-containing protein [Epithele typhae]|uniref:FAD-binding domain-containing protein n=1 Tax=Epithele typhae TaxID=378194 RepID=UPI00200744DD|nr:FAD-binding domain-containing protein [Epithele typhae]KAH9945031.1 FAD-binding domain-containing protein [Epithele typhae]